jgi:hypothetical protein
MAQLRSELGIRVVLFASAPRYPPELTVRTNRQALSLI